ncbi:hypothetical protein [Cystobacter fuscus]|uniref:hypothetical protein n=1 Tax=Cystobacter fuscus TaxID=43 RepID=UPI002B2AD2A2|nr:hypothetical protein F0U63_01130 [Cystobacter fuscus]
MTRSLLSVFAVALLATGCGQPSEEILTTGTQSKNNEVAVEGGQEEGRVSAMALCGTGLYCSASAANGATGCQQYTGGPTIYCCPSGYGLINGSCVPPCGTGLFCGWNYVSGSNVCVQNPSNTTAIYCCPYGKNYTSTGCI